MKLPLPFFVFCFFNHIGKSAGSFHLGQRQGLPAFPELTCPKQFKKKSYVGASLKEIFSL